MLFFFFGFYVMCLWFIVGQGKIMEEKKKRDTLAYREDERVSVIVCVYVCV